MLKHCPFCGKTDTVKCLRESEIKEEEANGEDYFTVICDYQYGGCGSSGGYRKTEEDAIKLWNTRR